MEKQAKLTPKERRELRKEHNKEFSAHALEMIRRDNLEHIVVENCRHLIR